MNQGPPLRPSDTPSVTECLPPPSSQTRPIVGRCPYVVESIPDGPDETIQRYVIRALGIRWQHKYKNDIFDSKWMDIDPLHIPWRVIAGNKCLQGWTMHDIKRQLDPLHPILPYEMAMEDRKRARLAAVTLPPIDPGTYAEIRMTTNGQTTVFVYFGHTGERVIIDIDIIFLQSDIGFLIQAILRRCQQQGRQIFVRDPDESHDPWGELE